jgi:putative transposase
MPRLSATPIVLSEQDRTELEALVRAHTTPQQIALRTKIILKAGEGKGHGEISRELEVGKEMSRRWCNRWLATQ